MYGLHILLILLLITSIGQFKTIHNESFIARSARNDSVAVQEDIPERSSVHMNRDLDTVSYSSGVRVFRNGELMVNKNDRYLDYKEIYGIRYSPLPVADDSAQQSAIDPLLNPEDNSVVIESNDISSYDGEKNSIVTESHAIRPQEQQPTLPEHIMRPTIFKRAMDFLRDRLKNLYIRSFIKNSEESKIVQDLKSSARFLNIFNVIKFENIPCSTYRKPLRQLNGVCYLETECRQLGGVAVDKCADNYGVCCVFQNGCETTTKQNISYFESPNFPRAIEEKLSCTLTVELQRNVKQVLLEFLFFELMPPMDGSCVEDQFIVVGQGMNKQIPILCGINTGQHMYIDVDDPVTNRLFLSVLTSSINRRAFSIRVTQLSADLAPPDCLQYYTNIHGYIQSFNYDDSAQIVEYRRPNYFNNLNYAICLKRNPGFCTVTYSNEVEGMENEFQLMNIDEEGLSVIPPRQAGAEIFNCPDDYIAINYVRLCGEKLNDASISGDFSRNSPVTDYSAGPIVIPVRTNNNVVGRGFRLAFSQEPCQII